ncbi:MAG: T9SS type A sorting domain-containing protein [Chitinivibrionales bacterium]|nr:T9SS type A sorting domain-containing protein [Chitinivibrionales bacterium]
MRLTIGTLTAIVLLLATPVGAQQQTDTTVPDDGSVLQITYPNGGELWHAGDTVTIRWLAVDTQVDLSCVWLTDHENAWIVDPAGCFSPDDQGWEQLRFVVPRDLPPGNRYRVVIDNFLRSIVDSSDADFQIAAPDSTRPADGAVVELTSPVLGEKYHVGDTVPITWVALEARFYTAHAALMFDSPDEIAGFSYTIRLPEGALSPHDESWGHVRWVIPEYIEDDLQLNGTRLAGTTAYVLVHDFMREYSDWSEQPITILAADNAVKGSTRRVEGRAISIQRSPTGDISVGIRSATQHRVEIFTASGARLLARSGTGPAHYDVATRHLSPGMYLLSVATPGDSRTRPFVKAR